MHKETYKTTYKIGGFRVAIQKQNITDQVVLFLKEQIENGYEYYRIFDQDGFCGYCGIHPENGKLFLSKLYLKKEARGKHLATNVFEFLKQLCRERGLTAIWLTCNKHNDNSLAVYRHLGFETVDTQVADIGNGFVMDDYIMEVTV